MELQTTTFDYSILDKDTSDMLQASAYRINQISSRSAFEIGKELKEAQESLAKKGYGIFTEWFESLGFKKTKAYQYINHYNFVRSESERSNIERFESLPSSLQNEMAKPSANAEINDKVFKGDITTHKEYKELEKQLKQQSEEIERLKNKPPQVIEKPVTKEVVPHDYGGLKSDNQQLSRALQQAQSELERTRSRNKAIEEERNSLRSQMQDMGEKSAKYDEMNEAIQKMNGQLDAGQQKLKAQKEIYDLVKNAETLIREIAPLTYLINGEEILNNEYARKPVEKIVGDLRDMADRLESSIEKQILEGVIINE